jgi:hypothetical protein
LENALFLIIIPEKKKKKVTNYGTPESHAGRMETRICSLVSKMDVPPRRPGFAYGQHVGFVVDKAALGQVFSEYFVSPANHSTDFSIIIITQG